MKRNVYFAFHYEDVVGFRANVIRNLPNIGAVNFVDRSLWEREWTRQPQKIRAAIDQGLLRTHATCVLIGSDTWQRPWVRYEIAKSLERGNGIFGVHINRIRDKGGRISARGRNPLEYMRVVVSENAKFMTVEELRDGKWRLYDDLPIVRTDHFWWLQSGKRFRLSEYCNTYCYKNDDGSSIFDRWVEEAILDAIPAIRK